MILLGGHEATILTYAAFHFNSDVPDRKFQLNRPQVEIISWKEATLHVQNLG